MKTTTRLTHLAYGLGLAMFAGGVTAHGLDQVGQPACLEANFMMADAMNAPFNGNVPGTPGANGPGQVLEVSIVTGARGITVGNPFSPGNAGGPICPDGVACPGPFKPTGVLSGGLNGHAFITSAAQHALTQFHRNGDPIRTVSYNGLTNGPGETGFGQVPRPLGSQMMPNGNIVQAICDANFFNASNSDTNPDGSNRSNNFFPPVYTTAERSANSRILVIDQETMQVIDEYSQPKDKDPRWTCAAGIAFSEEGMGLSMFHGAAIAMVDWKAGIDKYSRGVGSNKARDDDDSSDDHSFQLGKKKNRAHVTRWIDLRPGKPADDPSRRDSLRAWGYDEDGTIYVTDRERDADCLENEACSPANFRQKVQVVDYGDDFPSRTIGLDPGVNVIAGIRPNRMSAVACDNIGGPNANGLGTSCDVETLLIAASAFNPTINGGGFMKPGGGVGEYSILPADADGVSGPCTGEHGNAAANTGCAQPIATFLGRDNVTGNEDLVDPRMLMVIHEAFVQ